MQTPLELVTEIREVALIIRASSFALRFSPLLELEYNIVNSYLMNLRGLRLIREHISGNLKIYFGHYLSSRLNIIR